ncbi:MAG: PAS domain-containing sensor histidine kinase [Melioribacteraceae bacterium]|nr:PAS domain-containing sensor histidine kinase [Melioribacteraceae bacterium]
MNYKNEFSYKLIFEETVDAIIITDGSSEKIVDVNKAGCELFVTPKEELVGDYLSNYLDDTELTRRPKSPSEITMFGSVLSNKRIKSKSGELIPVDMIINTFGDETGNYVMTSFRDVSDRIKYENKIVSINEELHKTNASKDKFFSILAHDLKNPISSLIMFSELMTGEDEEITPEEMQEFLLMMKNLSKSTYELLENLLNWARVQTKNISLEKTEFQLDDVISRVVDLLQPTANLKKINLVNEVNKNFVLTADENMINTVIRNFVSNSIKFSEENKSIFVNAYDNEIEWIISVKDEGIGIDESLIEDLFKIDVHTSRQGTNHERGTGLGLVLCNEFIKLHNGSIEVKSKVNEGSEFIIHIPKE